MYFLTEEVQYSRANIYTHTNIYIWFANREKSGCWMMVVGRIQLFSVFFRRPLCRFSVHFVKCGKIVVMCCCKLIVAATGNRGRGKHKRGIHIAIIDLCIRLRCLSCFSCCLLELPSARASSVSVHRSPSCAQSAN